MVLCETSSQLDRPFRNKVDVLDRLVAQNKTNTQQTKQHSGLSELLHFHQCSRVYSQSIFPFNIKNKSSLELLPSEVLISEGCFFFSSSSLHSLRITLLPTKSIYTEIKQVWNKCYCQARSSFPETMPMSLA